MSRLLTSLLTLVGGGAAIGGGFLLYSRWRASEDADPATPIPLPDLPPPSPGSIPTPEASPVSPAILDPNEVEALARVIASEAGSSSLAEQKAIGWTVRNRFRGKSIYQGEFPWRAQKGADPPFSSARPASDTHRQLAQKILVASSAEDPTGGATAFFEPKMQDVFAKAGELARAGETGDRMIDGVRLTDITRFKNYKKNAAEIRKKWSPGSALLAVAGKFELWGSPRLLAQHGGVPQTIVGYAPSSSPRFIPTPEDALLLGRALQSALPSGTVYEHQALAWVCRNRARRLGDSVGALLEGGYLPIEKLPSETARKVAQAVLALPEEDDPTQGAFDYWLPGAQAWAYALGQAVSEAEAREALAQAGLSVCGVVGRVELLS